MKLQLIFIICALFVNLVCSQTIIAVMKLTSSGIQDPETQSLTDALRSELGKTEKFKVMERSMMEEILKEQGFQQSGACSEASCAITMGQLLAVKYMVLGNVGKVGKTFTLNVRLVEVSTGSIIKDITEYHKGEIDGLLTEVIPKIVHKISINPSTPNETTSSPDKKNRKKPFIIASLITIGTVAVTVPVLLILTKDDESPVTQTPLDKDLTVKW